MIEISTLKNGLVVLTDTMPSVETVSVGVFTNAGSLNETEANNGVAHFLEHMAFKGTKRRNALQIAEEMESLGAETNAYTSHEKTGYYVKAMKEHLPNAIDFLADIVQNSIFDATEMERERGVILQEIDHYEETPDDAVFDYFNETAYQNQPMGRRILGPKENVRNMQPDDLRAFINTNYGTNTMVVSVAGNVDHAQAVWLVETHFAKLGTSPAPQPEKPVYNGGLVLNTRPLEQAHLVLGYQAMPLTDKTIYNAKVWSAVLGGGMSSRLFQEIREKRGLVYTIYSFMQSYRHSGMFGVYAGTAAKDVPELMAVLQAELQRATQDLSPTEVARAKTQLKSSLLMNLESTSIRMNQAASEFFTFGRVRTVEEVVAQIEAVTPESASATGLKILKTPKTLAAVGSKKAIETLS